jgi:hypothetical protein
MLNYLSLEEEVNTEERREQRRVQQKQSWKR